MDVTETYSRSADGIFREHVSSLLHELNDFMVRYTAVSDLWRDWTASIVTATTRNDYVSEANLATLQNLRIHVDDWWNLICKNSAADSITDSVYIVFNDLSRRIDHVISNMQMRVLLERLCDRAEKRGKRGA
jgi:hypothetical protein